MLSVVVSASFDELEGDDLRFSLTPFLTHQGIFIPVEQTGRSFEFIHYDCSSSWGQKSRVITVFSQGYRVAGE
jgi:hypothetical protein